MRSKDILTALSLVAFILSLILALPTPALALFEQVDIGLVSIGGRAGYYDPNQGDANWYGGARVRLHLFRFFAIEGSADYRQNNFGSGTTAHSDPVHVSGLIYPLGTTRLAPFILGGGGWYYTTVSGAGNFDNTQNRFGPHASGGLKYSNLPSLPYRILLVGHDEAMCQLLQDILRSPADGNVPVFGVHPCEGRFKGFPTEESHDHQ